MILTFIGLGLGFASIIVTIIVAILVYQLQKKENESSKDILNKINGITENQAKIIESFDKRRINHVAWFVHHVGGVLESLKEDSQELISRIQKYQTTKSEEDLHKIIAGINLCKMSLNQVRTLSERDIPIAANYLSDPWIAGKFLDVIPLLDTGISNDKEQIRGMEFEDFIMWEGLINQRISEMENYLETIKQEGSSEN